MNQNYINHVALVLDRSISMDSHRHSLIKVADELVRHLAVRSTEMDQETRVTIYSFGDDVQCLVYDKDVLRLPSIATLYRISGNTALIDATVLSQMDLAMTPEKYGEHAFLTYVLTDGQENRSRNYTPSDLKHLIGSQPDHWTVAALVPNISGERYAKSVGFYPGNISIWDTTSQAGLTAAMATVRSATDNFMGGRSSGVRGTRTLFSTGVDAVNKTTIKEADLKPLKAGSYLEFPVTEVSPIRPFVQSHGHDYVIGKAYYQLTKSEEIQAQKSIAVRRRKDGKVFVGPEARDLLGLPSMTVRVKPDYNPDFDVFVQSTSINRNLVPNTKLLVLV